MAFLFDTIPNDLKSKLMRHLFTKNNKPKKWKNIKILDMVEIIEKNSSRDITRETKKEYLYKFIYSFPYFTTKHTSDEVKQGIDTTYDVYDKIEYMKEIAGIK